jgi:hypothetical protein
VASEFTHQTKSINFFTNQVSGIIHAKNSRIVGYA